MGVVRGDMSKVEVMYVDNFVYANPITDLGGTALTAGGPENGDGAIFQVGYFEGVSHLLNPALYDEAEWAQFTPLTGLGSPNSERHKTSIGGFGNPVTGPFGFLFYPEAVAIELNPAFDMGLPDSEVRLGVRFFNGTTMAGSDEYNIVTSDDLLWILQLADPSPDTNSVLNMDQHSLYWASGTGGAFVTSMAYIPEPGSVFLVLVGGLVLSRRRRIPCEESP